jgi:hypothetical protein
MRRLLLVGLLLGPVGGRAESALDRDLGAGLAYRRVGELPRDLPAPVPGRPPALVLDLRFLAAGEEGAAALTAWLEARAAQGGLVFVLGNGDTAGPVRQALAERRRGPGVVVVGRPAEGFAPDLAVSTTAARERAAWDALAAGTPPATLLRDHPDKERNDEARLARGTSALPAPAAGAAASRAPPPHDGALQRAVHLHRTLLALRKI